MKKIFIIIIILILSGCSNNKNIDDNKVKEQEKINDINEIAQEINTKDEIIDKYVDTNTIKIALYQGNNGIYKRIDKFKSNQVEMKVIGVFSIVLSNEESVSGNNIKSLYNLKKGEYEEFDNYKIGFNIKFSLSDGTVINENILRPLGYGNYGFSPYLYAWVYDDVHANGFHSHIEENEYDENTIMSSIKLMWGTTSNQIASDIELSVFTYDNDDFDELGNYRGISKFTTIIEKN